METATCLRLQENIPKILSIWEKRALEEVTAAKYEQRLALRDSIPEYLKQLVSVLNPDEKDKTPVGKKHGSDRANDKAYTMDQMLLEYQILRQCICEVLEETASIPIKDREIIVCSIEEAASDAATQFTEINKTFHEHLAHILVHDLRNPLTAAKVSAELILRKIENKEYCLDKTQRIIKNLDRIDKMISELLDSGRSQANVIFKHLDLDLLINEVAEESNLSQANLLVVKSTSKCFGTWNEDGLRRMIENLTTNAIKYGEKDTHVTLTLTHNEKTATLRIHNEGKPIPREEQSILFHKFRRSREAEKKQGWGLGLTVVQGVVDAHHGTIRLESEPGKGTTFIIELPKGSE